MYIYLYIYIYIRVCVCCGWCSSLCIYMISVLIYLSIFRSTLKVSSDKGELLLFDSNLMVTWWNWPPK